MCHNRVDVRFTENGALNSRPHERFTGNYMIEPALMQGGRPVYRQLFSMQNRAYLFYSSNSTSEGVWFIGDDYTDLNANLYFYATWPGIRCPDQATRWLSWSSSDDEWVTTYPITVHNHFERDFMVAVFVDSEHRAEGTYINGTWAVNRGADSEDILALYRVEDNPRQSSSTWWQSVGSGAKSGNFSTSSSSSRAAWSMPCYGGPYIIYYLAIHSDRDTYTIAGKSVPFYRDSPQESPQLIANRSMTVHVHRSSWAMGSFISASFSVSPAASCGDWIGVYRVGDVPGYYLRFETELVKSKTWWQYVPSGSMGGNFSTSNSSQCAAWSMPCGGGPYVLYYLLNDGYTVAGQSAPFDVEIRTATVHVDRSSWAVGSFVSGWFSVSPATSCGDWIGVYQVGDVPGAATMWPRIWWQHVPNGTTGGNFSTSNSSQRRPAAQYVGGYRAWSMPRTGGPYVVYFLLNDGYTIAAQSDLFDATTGDTESPGQL